MNYDNYYLDLKKVFSLKNEEEKKYILGLYENLYMKSDFNKKTILLTLIENKYLKSIREERLKKILDNE